MRIRWLIRPMNTRLRNVTFAWWYAGMRRQGLKLLYARVWPQRGRLCLNQKSA